MSTWEPAPVEPTRALWKTCLLVLFWAWVGLFAIGLVLAAWPICLLCLIAYCTRR